LFWLLHFVVGRLEKPYFVGFLFAMGAAALLVLGYFIWWWASRRIPFSDRLYGFILIVGGTVMAPLLVHQSIGVFGVLTTGLPIVLTVWTLWMFVVKKTALSWNRLGSIAVVALAWGLLSLVRIDGVDSDLKADLRWRWSPSAEEMFLAEKAKATDSVTDSQATLSREWKPSLTPGDWTEFRGADREGVIRGVRIATNWSEAPPRLVWRQRVGPAWSSVIVIGDRLFTQEQRGDRETVVCYSALTGKEFWVHEDAARFWDSVSGAGPRATPTYADGRIYTLGGTGILNCLDAATGKSQWSHDITKEAGSKVPLWGMSGSPLVVRGLVVVFAGGEGEKNLLAYRAASGELAWTAPAGPGSYSSPHLATIAGEPQCMMLSEHGLTSVEPATGRVLWKTGLSMPGAPRTLQPHVVEKTQLVVGSLEGPGVALIDVTKDGDAWKVDERWASKDLKPEFPDFVVHEGHVYGFDTSFFCCIDLETGKRCWRGGRYGRGQVVLLADQSLLLVLSETGQAILVAANPERHQELGRFQAITGKTWNHPVIAHGRLYARNAEEMACFELQQERSKSK
jgi:outer membrane protein assembly factor BamB